MSSQLFSLKRTKALKQPQLTPKKNLQQPYFRITYLPSRTTLVPYDISEIFDDI